MEGPSAATKRGAKAVSRRGPQPTVEDMRPLVSSVSSNHGGGTNGTMGGGGKANLPSPPRSGQFLHQPFPTIEKDDHHKRRYRVNLPYRMLFVLTMVFLMIPLLIFFYKETHIHRAHDHFKPERFVNVKTKDVLSQFSDHAHGTAQPLDDEDSPDDEAAAAAAVVEETNEDSSVVEKESEPVQEPQISATEAKEETKKEEPRKEEEGETTIGKNEPVDVVETAEEKDKKVSVDGDRNDNGDQTSEGEKVQPEAPTVVEEESKQRIRRRV